MSVQIEVCIDNIESLPLAISGGATRIELCSSLALGGLTPSAGFIQQAVKVSTVPVYVMIRPRQGDFFYNEDELQIMASDIEAAGSLGADGIVIGLLDEDGNIDVNSLAPLLSIAKRFKLGVTFHRAFDQARDPHSALEHIIALQCERLLTSGLAPSAVRGVDNIKKLVSQANGRISIMAGAGVTPDNALNITADTGVKELHLSGKSTRQSNMKYITENAKMGDDDLDDYSIPVTDQSIIKALKKQLHSHN